MSKITYEFAHLGINSENANEATEIAELLKKTFNIQTYDIGNSIFASESLEILKFPCEGKNGHIGIYANDLVEAIRELEGKGIAFDYKTLQKTPEGEYISVYLKEEIAGFAFHLLKKIDKS